MCLWIRLEIVKSWRLKCDIILESRDEFIEIKFYDSRNILEPNETLILIVIQEFLFVIIKNRNEFTK
jgi:hypothetical protein